MQAIPLNGMACCFSPSALIAFDLSQTCLCERLGPTRGVLSCAPAVRPVSSRGGRHIFRRHRQR